MIDDAIAAVVRAAVRAELADHANVGRLAYTVEQAADAIGCSPQQIRQLVTDGTLGTVPHMGRRHFIPRADLEALVSEGASTTSAGGRTAVDPSGVVGGPAETEPSPTVASLPVRRLAGGGPTTEPHDAA